MTDTNTPARVAAIREPIPSHVSVYIEEEMQARNWDRDQLASRMCAGMSGEEFGITRLALDLLLDAHSRSVILGEQAAELSRAFGASSELWTNLHEKWRNHPAIIACDPVVTEFEHDEWQMAAEILRLREALTAATRDGERLDALEKAQCFEVSTDASRVRENGLHYFVTLFGEDDDMIGTGESLREAIDGAITDTARHAPAREGTV